MTMTTRKGRAKALPIMTMTTQDAMELVMQAVHSPYTKVNDGGDLHPDENDGYCEDQESKGLVWISSRPNKVLIGASKYSYQPWVEAVMEAENRVYSLVQKGHARARAVVDLHYEMALACDDCGLWSAVGHRSRWDKFSTEYESGALIASESCDPQAIHKLFGREFDPGLALDREELTDYGMDSSQARKGNNNATATKKC